jgi:hypothetical protein
MNQAVEIYSEEHFQERSQRVDPQSWERIRQRAAIALGQSPTPPPPSVVEG